RSNDREETVWEDAEGEEVRVECWQGATREPLAAPHTGATSGLTDARVRRLRGGLHRHEDLTPLTVHQKQHRPVARAPHRCPQPVDARYRRPVHLLDDVAGLNTGIRRTTVRIHILHDNALRVLLEVEAPRELRCNRGHGDAERSLVLARRLVAGAPCRPI